MILEQRPQVVNLWWWLWYIYRCKGELCYKGRWVSVYRIFFVSSGSWWNQIPKLMYSWCGWQKSWGFLRVQSLRSDRFFENGWKATGESDGMGCGCDGSWKQKIIGYIWMFDMAIRIQFDLMGKIWISTLWSGFLRFCVVELATK